MGGGACVYLIGGTTESHLAAGRLRGEGYRVVVSVATPHGAACAGRAGGGGEVEAGARDARQLAARAGELAARAIVDCSHPFAVAASLQARQAAGACGIPYLRFSRRPLPVPDWVMTAGSWEEAAAALAVRPGRALLTVGTRHLETFVNAGVDFTARILPVPESLEHCRRLGIDPANIIAAHPPFDAGFTQACIRHARAGILVSKESGAEGGQAEKIEAAGREGIDLLLVKRPEEPGAIHELDGLTAALGEALSKC